MFLLESLLEALEGQKQKRFDYLLKTYEPSWKDGVEGYKDLKKFLEAVGKADPTLNGAYMQWIASRIIKSPEQNRAEDLKRVKTDLTKFEEVKSKLEKRDLNQYKSFADLFGVIAPFLKPKKETAAEKRAREKLEKVENMKSNEIESVYNGPEGWIKIPKTRAAACFLGQNTRWCTASNKNSMFDHYNTTDRLFVIYDKSSRQRSQLHINSGQFADEADRNKTLKAVPAWAGDRLVKWYHQNEKKLGLKHIFAFHDMGHKDAGKGTEHEELLDLFTKFGV